MPGLFEIPVLNRAEARIDDHEARTRLCRIERLADLIDLASTKKRRWTALGKRNDLRVADHQIDGRRQADRLFKALFRAPQAGIFANEIGVQDDRMVK